MAPDTCREVAFVGRSNAGKSSLINAVTGRKALARTSHTPGRTQEIVFFQDKSVITTDELLELHAWLDKNEHRFDGLQTSAT